MSLAPTEILTGSGRALAQRARGKLFRKYVVLLVGLVAGVLVTSGGLSTYFSYQHEKATLAQIQHEKAVAAAALIRQFIEEIEAQIGWTTQLSLMPDAPGVERRRIDYLRLLRQAPAITDIAFLNGEGREQLRVSRLVMDVVGSQTDFSGHESFRTARDAGVYYGPIYFRQESEPYMTLATRGSSKKGDVTVAEINLKFIRDVISEIRVGAEGYAYVVDAGGRLVAHPDLALVLRQTDLAALPQVREVIAARSADEQGAGGEAEIAVSLDGREVLSAHAAIAPLGWHVLVETPLHEAFAPLYTMLLLNAGLLLLGLAVAVLASLFLARNLVGPIRALQGGAARIGKGDLHSRIDIRTGDEFQALAEHFKRMAAQLRESYASLEHKVEERTRQLERSVKELETLGEVSRAINSTLELRTVLGAIAAHAVALAEADAGVFCAYDEEAQVFRLQAAHELDPDVVEALTRRPVRLGEGAVGRAGLERCAVQIPDVDHEPGYALHDIVRKPSYRALLAVPLLREDSLVGGLVLCRKAPGPFAAEAVDLVQTLANQSVLAIQNAELFQEIERKNRELETLSNKLAKYLSPQVYNSIFSGQQEVKIASQRKKLTVLFCDVVGFTATTERLESEDLTHLLNHYLTAMSHVALDHGATIDKYIGDAIMMFFGDPESRGVREDALACVRTALAMRRRMRELEGVWRDAGVGAPLRCRIGISTAYCTVGNFGSEDRMDYTIVGAGVNLASRLEQAAPPGGILISYETYALVKDVVCCQERGCIQAKGIADPVAAYEVLDLYENVDDGQRPVHEELAHIRLDLDLAAMSEDERREAVACLGRALDRLAAFGRHAPDAAPGDDGKRPEDRGRAAAE